MLRFIHKTEGGIFYGTAKIYVGKRALALLFGKGVKIAKRDRGIRRRVLMEGRFGLADADRWKTYFL